MVNIKEEHVEFEKFKQKVEQESLRQRNDHVLPLVNEVKKEIIMLNRKVV